VEEKDVNAPSLICLFYYVTPPRDQTRVTGIILEFIDIRTLKRVLVVTGKDDNFVASHGEIVDEMFAQICAKYLPGRPNPFAKK